MGKLHNNARLANVAGTPINPATEDTVSQLVMAVTNALDFVAYDINAGAFSEATDLSNDFILDIVYFNFTSASARNIVITTEDGTQLYSDAGNTDTHLVLRNYDMGFNGGENITVDVSQAGAACLMDCILRVRSGTNTLLGDPSVKITDTNSTVLSLDALVASVPTTDTFHHLGHEGMVFIHGERHNAIANGANYDILIRIPAGNANRQVHLRFAYVSKANTGTLDVDVLMYKDVVTSADGAPEIIVSTNDAVVKTTGVLMFSGPTIDNEPADLGEYKTSLDMFGEKKSASSGENSVPEWILAPDGASARDYLMRLTNNSGGTIDFNHGLFFYDSGAT